ncbi:ABC transporter A family protein [Cavenderia fasciculata]|uniref:ABC transporter A family protein n=1 Tax=Cavenderia fasciculata TaxID=261658 RepID=F4QDS6_CACFS|nr:ABC transporter A family protein [Cavenderia fasciculata]EGG13873.1 ABC transporter A family protein [Cavenderia fasciculata]|eukprot:XP_004350581.1 ABC transporter A family protein [Cavenderia fasciculata]
MPLQRELLQTKLLLKKNLLVSIRSWVSTLVEILSPAFFILILLIISKSPSPMSSLQRPAINYDSNIPICTPYVQDNCVTLLYSPSNSTLVNELMQLLAEINSPQLNISTNINQTGAVVPMYSVDDMNDFIANNPNVTMAAVEFQSFPENFTDTHHNDPILHKFSNLIMYNVLWNATCPNFINPKTCIDYAVPVNAAIHKAIHTYQARRKLGVLILGGGGGGGAPLPNDSTIPSITFSTSTFPLYDASLNAVGTYGCLFFYCGSMISFIFLMYKVSFEKEKHLKQGMIMMGLNGSVYFVSWFITCLVINVLLTLITIGVGAACQFSFFLSTNFFVNFLTFFLYILCMTQVAFFILTFIQSTKAAIGIGMTIFIVGSIIQLIFSLMSTFLFQILYETDNTSSLTARVILYVLPMYHFSKIVTDINQVTLLSKFTGVRFDWSNLYANLNSPTATNVNIPSTYESLVNLLILSIGYTVLAWYFEHIVPGNDGTSQPPWFFLLPSYWGISKKTPKFVEPPHFDQDILDEIEKANDPNNQAPVIIRGLSKTYHNMFNSKKDVKAVRYLSLSIEKGSVLCLLGHNGSGKSTTIGMLTGLISPSSGDAMIFGKSVISEIDQVRKQTSVCPQHDILWNQMSAYEHLELFAELKGIDKSLRKQCIDDALESVRLTRVAKNQITSYSGGMKRRLSIAIATIGDPNIIFFDEPTGSLDVASRRHIWNLIKEIKKDKVIILTTHLMDEADMLSDRIIILNHGVMACNGNSLQLKHKYGNGYSVNIIAKSQDHIPEIKSFMNNILPNSKLIMESADYLNFGIPLNTDETILQKFFKTLEELSTQENNPIRDFAVSQASIDDVFLNVTKLKHE